MTRSVWKGPFVDGYLLEEGGCRALVRSPRFDPHMVAAVDHIAAIRRAVVRGL